MIQKLVFIAIIVGLIFPTIAAVTPNDAEAGVACWVYTNMGNHPLAWDLCNLEIWAASGHPEVPDPGGDSRGSAW